MKVLVVSGFLGAGKTTFIRELVKHIDKSVVILENEYGEIDLDGGVLKGQTASEVLDLSDGCACCSQKDRFVNTVLAVSAGQDPDYLIVEPTGIGRLGSILESLKRIRYERIRLLAPVVVLSPRGMDAYLRSYPEIYRDQIAHAGQILLSKTEREDRIFLNETIQTLRGINAHAPVTDVPYTEKDEAFWQSILTTPLDAEQPAEKAPSVQLPAASTLRQVTVRDGTLQSAGELIRLLEDVVRGRFGEIARAKGMLKVRSEWLRFDCADGLYAVTDFVGENPVSQCVFIGQRVCEDRILDTLHVRKTAYARAMDRLRGRGQLRAAISRREGENFGI